MPSFFVVPGFNPLKNIQFCLTAICIARLINTFHFEALKKAFCHGIIPTVSLSAHALSYPAIALKQACKLVACNLNSSLGVKD